MPVKLYLPSIVGMNQKAGYENKQKLNRHNKACLNSIFFILNIIKDRHHKHCSP